MTEDERNELNIRININAMFRKRVVEEDNLIHQRMACMIWAEALLLAAWSATFVKDLDTHPKPPLKMAVDTILIGASIFGLITAIFGFIAISGAWSEIKRMKALYKTEFHDVSRDPRIPELTGDSKNNLLGQAFPFIVPIGFILLQLALIVVWRFLP